MVGTFGGVHLLQKRTFAPLSISVTIKKTLAGANRFSVVLTAVCYGKEKRIALGRGKRGRETDYAKYALPYVPVLSLLASSVSLQQTFHV